ncbi:hypothetical protein WR25_10144 [Diploscapter pachys]|uniref:Leucine-rich repeat-containing protein 58 n=1 Tax=Diploscapter pachys TaxID=2018661 RepID=A0A2A2LEW4_9BILA|nr:hypothetical protein WR25_10144 [Diploscapter pachys]
MENQQQNNDVEVATSSTRFQEIALVNYRLEELPEGYLEEHGEFYSPLRVSSLNLSQNHFIRIDGIGRFANLVRLEILYLGGNRLKEVPATIGRLSNLTSLVLCDNILETIPSTLGQLTNLESLSLHNNLLRTLPTEIIKLQNLQQLSLRNNPLVQRFVHTVEIQPPTLKEMAGRIVRMKMAKVDLRNKIPRELLSYLASANQCVNPKCKGVYFEAFVEHVKFVDFCGKYRVPLLQFLCSPRCSANVPESPYASSSSSESDDDLYVPAANQNDKMRKVLLG